MRASVPPRTIAKSASPFAASFGLVILLRRVATPPRTTAVAARGIRFLNSCVITVKPLDMNSANPGILLRAPRAVIKRTTPPTMILILARVFRTFTGFPKKPPPATESVAASFPPRSLPTTGRLRTPLLTERRRLRALTTVKRDRAIAANLPAISPIFSQFAS